MDDRKILDHYPLPIARGYRRYRNAAEVRERHDAAYYLFEIYLKYVASIAIASYLAGEARDHRVNAVLKGLARPSLGEWLRFLRECLKFLTEAEEADSAIQAMAQPLESKETRWPGVVELYNAMRSFRTGSASEKTQASLEQLLGEIVAYRNRVVGHGANLDSEHYKKYTKLLVTAFGEILDKSPFLTVRRLVSFDSIQVEESSRAECELIEFMGENPDRKDKPLVLSLKDSLPSKNRLYLLSDEGVQLSLDPLLVVYREDVYLLNEAKGIPEYLSYSTGKRHKPSSLGEHQENLFERILGYRFDETRLSQIGDEVTASAEAISEELKEGERRLGDYRILREIGRGGMGTVFEAVQESLGRKVALKVLPGSFALDPKRLERFRREARATARIHHPNIVPVYEVGEADGNHYYAMEYIDGPSLEELLSKAREESKGDKKTFSASDPSYVANVVEQIAALAEGLEEAHKQGLIHRDVKPSNILVNKEGRYVLVDFGLVHEEAAETITRSGEMVGTLKYMSPEQVSRRKVDARSDVYSLGATLYEVVTLRPPFWGESEHAIQSAILFDEPIPPRKLNPRLNRDLETIILHAIGKKPEGRYASAAAFAADLRRALRCEAIQARSPPVWTRLARRAARHKLPLGLAAGIVLVVVAAVFIIWRIETGQWVRTSLREIAQLAEHGDYLAAFRRAQDVESVVPGDPALADLWPLVTWPFTVVTTPPGADVSFREYAAVDGDWIHLGRSPLEGIRFPRGVYCWKLEKKGYETIECATPVGMGGLIDHIALTLSEEGCVPPGMIEIRAGRLTLLFNVVPNDAVEAPGFFIDRCEVTNEAFQEFVDAGGYRTPKHWTEPFVKDGRELTWDEAMATFHDETGQAGPSTWRDGKYPEGCGTYPVSGVSWFEAAAYARFREKDLPTLYHWSGGACTPYAEFLVPHSNFDGKGPAPVERYPGMSWRGLYDVAGNVREWCWNATGASGDRRYLVGGSWSSPTYLFQMPEALSPWDRSEVNGFRCVRYAGGRASLPEAALRPVQRIPSIDYSALPPCPVETFRRYRDDFYAYDPTDLAAESEPAADGSEAWTREKVTYTAAYGNEQMAAYFYLPRRGKAPYQTILLFPGIGAFPNDENGARRFEEWGAVDLPAWLIESGHALLYPIYAGSYDRAPFGGVRQAKTSITYREWSVQVVKDVRRSIDYLYSRADVDRDRIAYYGYSLGGALGVIPLALEGGRLKLGLLVLGSLWDLRTRGEVDPFSFAPHVTRPVLMVNAENDLLFPMENVKQMYRFLGTPEADKKLITYPGGHGRLSRLQEPKNREPRETILAWLNERFGPVP